MSDVLIPPTFSGDDLSSRSIIKSTVVEFGEFLVIQGSDDYVQVDMADQRVFLAYLFFVVKPSLRVYAMDSDELVRICQVQGRPEVQIGRDYRTPLLAFGGMTMALKGRRSDGLPLVVDRWMRFTFRSNPHSLSDYGWTTETSEENPLTPEWESFILSHGQEISHA